MEVLLALTGVEGQGILGKVLRERGHSITACTTIEEVIEARRRGGHRIVLLASRYIAGGGPSLCKQVRSAQGPDRAFLIAVAQGAGARERDALLAAGASDILAPGFDETVAKTRIAVAEELVRQGEIADRAMAALDARARQSQAVADLGRRALERRETAPLFEQAVLSVARTLDVEFVKVLQALPGGTELFVTAGVGWKPGVVGDARVDIANGSQAGLAFRSMEPVVVDDLRKETRFRGAALLRDHGVISGVSVPIRGHDRPFGVLGAHTARLRAFGKDEVLFLSKVANILGAAVARESAEDDLRASEDRARRVLESALDAVVVIDARETITSWNARAEEVFGWSRQEALGRVLSDLIVPPRDREAHRTGLARFLATGKGPFLNRRMEVSALRHGGQSFPAELSITPVRTPGGFLFYAFVRDISERARAQEALRASERFSRRLAEATPHAVFVFDLVDCRIEYASDRTEAVLGWNASDLVAMGPAVLERILPPDERPHLPQLRRRWDGIGDDDTVEAEGRVRDAQGGFRFVRFCAKVFSRTAEGGVRQIVGTCEDLTASRRSEEERRALDARVRTAQKMESLGVLAGGIAHDFNNLLTSVLGNAGLALVHMRSNSPARPFVGQIETAARRAADLTNQLLAYAGKSHPVLEPIDLSGLVREMVNLLQSIVLKEVRLESRLGIDVPTVVGDATQIRQVVMNLITNASEACRGRDGVVGVSTSSTDVAAGEIVGIGSADALPAGRYAVLRVADTGCGMSADTVARIFDPFFSTKMTGRGLGLAAVLGIVRGHHGAVRVESSRGRGSTFEILLPASPSVAPAPPPEIEVRGWRGTGTVLVVDDEEEVRRVSRAMLTDLGFEVLEACDGMEAVRMLRENQDRIVLILLDLTMPLLDGAKALPRLRAVRPDVPVLVSTGYAEEDVTARFAAGPPPAGILEKPFTLDRLRSTIQGILAGRTPR